MFLFPKFTTYHHFVRDYPDGSYEIVPDKEISEKKPNDVVLVVSKCITWLGMDFCYSEKDMEVRYEEV